MGRDKVHDILLAVADAKLVPVEAHLFYVASISDFDDFSLDLDGLADADAPNVEDGEFGAVENIIVVMPHLVPVCEAEE